MKMHNNNSNVFEYIYSKITIFKYLRCFNSINDKQKEERSKNES